MIVRAQKPRRGGKRAEQREASKRALLDAARRLFSEEGLDTVSVTDIANEAGLTASMINAYFSGKGGLLYALVTENNAPQVELAQQAVDGARTAMDKLAALFRVYARSDLRDPQMLANMQSFSWTWPPELEADNIEQRRPHEAIVAGVVRFGIQRGEFRALDVERTVTSLWAIYTWGLRPGIYEGLGPDECADRIIEQARDLLVAA